MGPVYVGGEKSSSSKKQVHIYYLKKIYIVGKRKLNWPITKKTAAAPVKGACT